MADMPTKWQKSKKKVHMRTTAFRLSQEDQQIVGKLTSKLGLDFSGLMRLAIRRLAEAENAR